MSKKGLIVRFQNRASAPLLAVRLLNCFGINPVSLLQGIQGFPSFLRDWRHYSKSNSHISLQIHLKDLYPVLNNRTAGAAKIDPHYFFQDLWAARRIFQKQPKAHVDVGSRIDGFIAHLLTFMPVTIVDIRPSPLSMDGLSFIQDDATELRMFADGSVTSLSSLHAAEHFGLGRYSDPIDPSGSFKFMRSLSRVLGHGGRLYFSVPIGYERVEFNAQRVFGVETVLQTFSDLKLVSVSFIGDDRRFYEDVQISEIPACHYGCGLFEFTK